MDNKQEFDRLYHALSINNRRLYLQSYREAISPVEKDLSESEKYRLCVYLIHKMLAAKRRKV